MADVPTGIFGTTIGEEDPDAEYPPAVDVAVKDEASPPSDAGVNVTETAPLLYARDVPTSVAVPIVADKGITPSCDQPAAV